MVQQDGNIFENIHPTPAQHHGKHHALFPHSPRGAGRDWVGSLDFPFHLGAAHGKVAGSSLIALQPGWCQRRLGEGVGLLDSHLKLHPSPYQLEGGGFGEEDAGGRISLNLYMGRSLVTHT